VLLPGHHGDGPDAVAPLLERFISESRKNEPPDIDVDFEHERREEVIQYIYGKYGRDRAAIAAVVISYRTRSAIRDVGKALGIAEPLVDAFAKDHFWFDDELATEKLRGMAADCGVPLPSTRPACGWNSRRTSWAFRATCRSTSAASCSRRPSSRAWCRWRTPA
jgi:hypothetical protein